MSLQTKTGEMIVSPSGFVCIFSLVLFSSISFQQLVYGSFGVCLHLSLLFPVKATLISALIVSFPDSFHRKQKLIADNRKCRIQCRICNGIFPRYAGHGSRYRHTYQFALF